MYVVNFQIYGGLHYLLCGLESSCASGVSHDFILLGHIDGHRLLPYNCVISSPEQMPALFWNLGDMIKGMSDDGRLLS